MRTATSLTFLSLGLSALAAVPTIVQNAEPPTLVARDLATVTSVVAQVKTGIDGLDAAVKAFTNDPAAVQAASASLLATLQSGTTTVQNTTPLSLIDALTLQEAVAGMESSGRALVTDLEAKKPAIQQAGLCAATKKQVADLAAGFDTLVAAVIAKLPEAVRAIANDAAAGFNGALDRSEASFAPESCVDGAAARPGSGTGSIGLGSPTAGVPIGAPGPGPSATARLTQTVGVGPVGNATRAVGGGVTPAATARPGAAVPAAAANVVAGSAGALAMAILAMML